MSHIALRCTDCGAGHPADMDTLACGQCGAPLEVEYLERDARQAVPLPLHTSSVATSLGDGGTPCVKLPSLAGLLGLRSLFAKLEFLNPTGSFKDRGMAVMMAVAREHGVTEVVEDSSGNAGASVSAYAARAGMRAHVFVPEGAPAAKLRQIRAYGAEVHPVQGTREAVTEAAVAFQRSRGIVYASHNLSPYFQEGTKTFAYEVAQQFPGGLPDHVVLPVGNGSLYIGAWKGFREMVEAGRIQRMPRLHCVQARAFMPVVAAYEGIPWGPDDAGSTVAGGVAAAAPVRQGQVLGALRAAGGAAVAVDDADILRWRKLLATREGVFAEPTAAVAFAGLQHLVGGVIGADETVLVPVTGFGLKDDTPG